METKIKFFFLGLIDAFIISVIALLLKEDIMSIFFLSATLMAVTFFIAFKLINKDIEVAKDNFEKAREENKEAIKMRTEFVTNVTHELKTPLTSISGFVETLQNGAIDDKDARIKFLGIIADETARLNRLIEDILTLSHIENSKNQVESIFSVREESEMVIKMIKPIAERKKITIENNISKDCKLSGNVDRFKQMMVNLVENAVKYGKENGHVWLETSKEEGYFIISVRDDGIGVKEDEIDRITERFYRVDKSRARVVDGTGLGLSIVKHTASLFGGQLSIHSKVDEGSVFKVKIPKNKIIL